MSKYTYKGTEALYYPSLGVSVKPGDVVELAANPGDGNWSAVKAAKATAAETPAPAPVVETPAPAPSPDASKAGA